jgi:hypothetical protein
MYDVRADGFLLQLGSQRHAVDDGNQRDGKSRVLADLLIERSNGMLCPSAGSASNMDSDEYPVYTPTSHTVRAPAILTSVARNRPSIGETAIMPVRASFMRQVYCKLKRTL